MDKAMKFFEVQKAKPCGVAAATRLLWGPAIVIGQATLMTAFS
jgi:hypothetical protein